MVSTKSKPNLNRSPNLTLIPKAKVWKVFKKVEKKWSHELKHASSHYYENISRQVRGEPKTIGTADTSDTLLGLCCLNDKVTAL